MSKKPLAREAIRARGRKIGSGVFVHYQRYSEILDGRVEGIVVRIVQSPPLDGIGPDKDPFEAELQYNSTGFLRGRFDILDWNNSNSEQTLGIGTAIIEQPVIVGPAKGRGVRLFFDRR